MCGIQDHTLMYVVYRTSPSYVCGVQDQTLIRICVVNRTRPWYVGGVQDWTRRVRSVLCICVSRSLPLHAYKWWSPHPGSLCTCLSPSLSPFSPATVRLFIFSSLHRGCGLHVSPQSGVQVPQLPSRSTAHTHIHRCYGSVLHPAYNSVYVHTYLVLPTNNACTTVYTVCSI